MLWLRSGIRHGNRLARLDHHLHRLSLELPAESWALLGHKRSLSIARPCPTSLVHLRALGTRWSRQTVWMIPRILEAYSRLSSRKAKDQGPDLVLELSAARQCPPFHKLTCQPVGGRHRQARSPAELLKTHYWTLIRERPENHHGPPGYSGRGALRRPPATNLSSLGPLLHRSTGSSVAELRCHLRRNGWATTSEADRSTTGGSTWARGDGSRPSWRPLRFARRGCGRRAGPPRRCGRRLS